MSQELKATIILPTTSDRAPVLPLSVACVLAQELTEFELFIIGDGVDEATRQTIFQLATQDDRIRFFDHPKHARRGEVYRHAALQEARGEIVAYLCDRDLWFPNHLSTLYQHLQQFDFATVNLIDVHRSGKFSLRAKPHHYGVVPNLTDAETRLGAHKLSSVGHTLAAYRRLPEGWRTTPAGVATDGYMWRQFIEHGGITMYNDPYPTYLYFKRGDHPGMPSAERAAELRRYVEITQEPALWRQTIITALGNSLRNDAIKQQRMEYNRLLIYGRTPRVAVRKFIRKLLSRN